MTGEKKKKKSKQTEIGSVTECEACVCRNWHSFQRGLVKQMFANMCMNTSQMMIFST